MKFLQYITLMIFTLIMVPFAILGMIFSPMRIGFIAGMAMSEWYSDQLAEKHKKKKP